MLSFYSSQSRSTRYLHAFPTRRSSDLRIFGEVLEVPPTQRTSVQVHPGRVPTLGAIGLRLRSHRIADRVSEVVVPRRRDHHFGRNGRSLEIAEEVIEARGAVEERCRGDSQALDFGSLPATVDK